MKKLITAFLLLASSGSLAETHEELVRRAFDAMESDLSANWSYTETTRNGEGTFVARFDPRFPDGEHWDLLSIDGREPTNDELEEFRENKSRNNGDDDEPIAASGTIELLEETDDYWWFQFQPRADSDEDKKFMEAVDARVQVVKDGHYVSQISMRNTDTIKPGKGVKIRKFETDFEFAPAIEGGPVVPQRYRTDIQGKAFLVVKLDEQEHTEFSEFEKVTD